MILEMLRIGQEMKDTKSEMMSDILKLFRTIDPIAEMPRIGQKTKMVKK